MCSYGQFGWHGPTTRQKLEQDGFREITLRALERANNAFAFTAQREEQRCEGEIEVRDEMGQTTATVTSRCGDQEPSPAPMAGP